MRIWDLKPSYLCKQHLLGEHRELHAIWSILTSNKKGYSNHPETKRWRGKLLALYNRHEAEEKEFSKRGYKHSSFLDKNLAKGEELQNILINTLQDQKIILSNKKCDCGRYSAKTIEASSPARPRSL